MQARPPRGGGRAVGLARADPGRARDRQGDALGSGGALGGPGLRVGARRRASRCRSGRAARCPSRWTCRARSRSCSSEPSSTSSTCTSRSRPARRRRRCATRTRSTSGTFHSTTERFVSTQMARKVVELLFGRLDGRAASFAATRDLIERYFPGDYTVIHPGADTSGRPDARGDGPPEIVFSDAEERGALRLFIRALRRLPRDLDWRATIWLHDPAAAPAPTLSRRLRERVRLAGPADGSEAQHLARATISVAASAGTASAPQLVLRSMAGGAVPVVSRLPQYEELVRDGELGPLFEPRDALTLAAQLERLLRDPQLVRQVRGRDREGAPRARLVARGRRVRGALRAHRRAPPRRGRQAAAPPAAGRARLRARGPPHAHRPLARLRHAGGHAARHRQERRPGRDRDHRPQRDLGRARGARARERHQGDRGRGGQDRRPGRGDRPVHRGEDPARDDPPGDDRRDPAAGGPCLRAASLRPDACRAGLRAPAGRGGGHRRDRGLQPARGVLGLQRGGRPVRRQVPDRGRRGIGQPRGAGARLGEDPHARLRRAGGISRVAAGTPTSSERSSRSSTFRP